MAKVLEFSFQANEVEITPSDSQLFNVKVSIDTYDLEKISDLIPVSDICNCSNRNNEILDEIGIDYIKKYFDIE